VPSISTRRLAPVAATKTALGVAVVVNVNTVP
jgi:hypothetical protein